MKPSFLFLCIAAVAACRLSAGPINFDFKDPKGVNNAVFKLDAPLESINGTANGISGTITFDPDKPVDVKGRIAVAATSLHVGNSTMKEHLHGPDWLNAAKFPELVFEATGAKNAKTEGTSTTLDVSGNLTIKGVTKPMTLPVKFTYLKDKLAARQGKPGDLLVLRTSFTIKRSDFGINAAKHEEKVSNDIELSLNLAGAAPR